MGYQLIILGAVTKFEKSILDLLFQEINELGIDHSVINIIYAKDFATKYSANYPAYCLYIGSDQELDLDILKKLIDDATLILPIVSDLDKFSQQIPKILSDQNGFELSDENNIPSLVSCILEGFSLLRASRKVFISYKRSDSSSVAIQLYESLEKAGFDVFLDTHSIRPGEPFQAELWHRMTDSDIIILLNTRNFLGSEWTKEELAKASSLSIGIVQVIWPDVEILRDAEICKPIQLVKTDLIETDTKLTETKIKEIISLTEELRARTLAARQDNLITEFVKFARDLNLTVTLHREKFISVSNKKNEQYIFIPTVGVPQSLACNNAEILIKEIRKIEAKCICLLYDHLNIRDKWVKHLDWLDINLPIKLIKLLESEKIMDAINE